ncbi:MAG: Uma2 family endonuclease [Proteobacteria bacterium]|nr:Uma2 family endonuclease [Burkholderiales bacterium]
MGAEGELERFRWTVTDYHRMVEVGLLDADARVELIDGEIVRMAPIGLLHADCVNRIGVRLARAVGDDAYLSFGNPVRLSQYDEPQPDLMLLAPRSSGYSQHAPGPEDVLLAIEVSDSTLRTDLRIKVPLYARTGVAEVWVIDVENERLLAFDQLEASTYVRQREAKAGTALSPHRLPTLSIAVADIFNWRGG